MKKTCCVLVSLLALSLMLLPGCSMKDTVEEALDSEYNDLAIDYEAGAEHSDIDADEFDASLLYLKKVSLPMCDEYYLCYETDENEIAFLGIETPPQTPFHILNGKVYYIDHERKLSCYDPANETYTSMQFDTESSPWVLSINKTDDSWLYCTVEFIGEAQATQACKIKADFTEYNLDD